ncbi:MAG: V-type ATP synthase subunit I, partial [Alistipes sp.]
MSKYDFVLYAAQREDFLEQLRKLGLVDITTTGWEPSEEDRQLLLDIEQHAKADETLSKFRLTDRYDAKAQPFTTGADAFEHYLSATTSATTLNTEISRLQKSADDLRPWGDFSVADTKALADKGVVLRYFSVTTSSYDKNLADWSERYTLSFISTLRDTSYFV